MARGVTKLGSVRTQLLEWYETNRRDLPWRRTKDPYSIWVSEIMLQQTRVDTVVPYYEDFLQRWPTVRALADADPGAVRAAWSGLGYYRRARLMMEAAQVIVREHGGRLPADEASLHALPGFGAYTTGAVASIAFDRPVAAIDGNVTRVVARLAGLRGDPSTSEHRRAVKSWADALMPGARPGDLAQALMELGATICTPRKAACLVCPIRRACAAHRDGLVDQIPPPKKRKKPKAVPLTALILYASTKKVWLERRPDTGLFAGLWCPPLIEGHPRLEDLASHPLHPFARDWTATAERVHRLTHRELVVHVVSACTTSKRRVPGLTALRVDALGSEAIPSFTAKLLDAGLPAELRAVAKLPGRRTRPTGRGPSS